jgi:hypothetical protein
MICLRSIFGHKLRVPDAKSCSVKRKLDDTGHRSVFPKTSLATLANLAKLLVCLRLSQLTRMASSLCAVTVFVHAARRTFFLKCLGPTVRVYFNGRSKCAII